MANYKSYEISDVAKLSGYDLSINLPVAPQNKQNLVVIGERTLSLNKSRSKFVSVGLSYDYGFQPCIKLFGDHIKCVIFSESDWDLFLSYQGIITNYLYTNDRCEKIDAAHFCIDFECISTTRVIKISKNNSYIYLAYESVCKLWEFLPLIKYRLECIKRMQFKNYFAVLQRGLKRQSGNVFVNATNIIQPNENYNSENISLVMELMYVYPDVFELECTA